MSLWAKKVHWGITHASLALWPQKETINDLNIGSLKNSLGRINFDVVFDDDEVGPSRKDFKLQKSPIYKHNFKLWRG